MPFLEKNVICDGSACQNQSFLNERGFHFFLSTQAPVGRRTDSLEREKEKEKK